MRKKKEPNEVNTGKIREIESILQKQGSDINFLMTGLEDLKLRKESIILEIERLESLKSHFQSELNSQRNQFEEKMKGIVEKTQETSQLLGEQYARDIERKLKEAEREINGMKSRKIIIPFTGVILILTVINIILIFLI